MKSRTNRGSARSRSASRSRSTASSGRTFRSANTTINHDEIRQWVEQRGGTPATVKGTVRSGQEAGVLRIDFPGFSGQQTLKPITWDEWFQIFDERQLAFLYQDTTSGGKVSRFNKLVNRHD